jgi:hypothetical protein
MKQQDFIIEKSPAHPTNSIANKKFANDDERMETAKEYSKMFFTNLLKQMFKTTEDSSLWGNSHTSEMFRPIWIEAIADATAGKTGFEQYIYKSLGGKEKHKPFSPQPVLIGEKVNVSA